MSTIEYLRSLQKELEAKVVTLPAPENMKERRLRQLGAEAFAVDHKSLEAREEAFRRYLLDPLLEVIPVGDAILDKIFFGLLPTFDPNAWALTMPSGDHLIVMNQELPSVLSFYKEYELTLPLIEEHFSEAQLASKDAFREFYSLCVLRIVVDSFRGSRGYIFPVLPFELSREHMILSTLMTLGCELFIIAHELAHVWLGHTTEIYEQKIGLEKKEVLVDRLLWSQEQEFRADVRAVEILASLSVLDSRPHVAYAARSPAMCCECLTLIHLIELYQGLEKGPSSHPPAHQRLANILRECDHVLGSTDKEFLRGCLADMEGFARDIENLKDPIVQGAIDKFWGALHV